MNDPYRVAYVEALKTLLPHFTDEDIENCTRLFFSSGEILAKANKALGEDKWVECCAVRPAIHQYDRFAVYANGKYVYTVFSARDEKEAIRSTRAHPSEWLHKAIKNKHLTARRLGLLETDPYYLDEDGNDWRNTIKMSSP